MLINRPLNAVQKTIIRLADFEVDQELLALEEALKKLRLLENDYKAKFNKEIPLGTNSVSTADLFSWADDLETVNQQIVGLPTWLDHEFGVLRPRVQQIFTLLDQQLSGDLAPSWHREKPLYAAGIDQALKSLRNEASAISADVAIQIAEKIDPTLPRERWDSTLSQKSVWIASSTPGVSVVLCGMRQPSYVHDTLATLTWPNLEDAARAYFALRPE